jgi:amidase
MRSTLFALWVLSTTPARAAGLDGTWSFHMISFGEVSGVARLVLKTAGDTVTGQLSDDVQVEGTFRNGALTLRGARNGRSWGTLEGKLQGDALQGTLHRPAPVGDAEFRARLLPPPTAPQTRTFEPTVFHRFFSSTIAPALEINSGDTVRTWTVDSGGIDAKGVRRSNGGNPQTGPFFVQGAMPGDTLAVTLDRVRLNRDTANSGTRLIPQATDAGYLTGAKYDDAFRGQWKLDREAGYATPAASERLKNFRVKLQPMLGCIAVAPPQTASYRTGWLGNFGGNLDYNGMVEGVTVYLPVFHEGALLFLGDGHAAQGDGELTGDALETSLDVQFTVRVIPNQRIPGVRAENRDYIMALGVGNALPDALQAATTSLAEWIEREYRLTSNEAALVIGSSIRYDIAEITDPMIHVVAKLSKAALAPLKP